MMRIVYGWMVVLLVVLSATCAVKTGPIDTHGTQIRKGNPVRARIVLKRDPDNSQKCVARTMPKRIEIDPDENDGVIWQVKQKPGSKCLPADVDLEVRWNGPNPTACSKLGTHTSKNKTMFECDLDEFLPGETYTYKLWRVGGGLNEMVEDPEIEIVEF